MNKSQFLATLQDMLQCDEALQEDTVLAEREEWDSLAIMVLISFFDKNFGQRIAYNDLRQCRTIADLIALSKGAIA